MEKRTNGVQYTKRKVLTNREKRNGERIIEIKLGENIARDTNAKQKGANSS